MKFAKIALVAGLVLGSGFVVDGGVDAATKSKVVKTSKVVKAKTSKVAVKPVVKKAIPASTVVVFDRYAIPVLTKAEFEKSGFVGKGIVTDQNGVSFANFETFEKYKEVRDGYFISDIPMAKFYFEKMDNDIMHVLENEYKSDMYKAAEFFKEFK